MNKILKIFFGAILVSHSAISVNAQTTIPCPDVSLPFYLEDTNPSGSGQEDWADLTDPQNLLQNSPQDAVLRWQGSKPIQINYTTPQTTDHSLFPNCILQADLDACIANDFAEWTRICPGMFTVTKVSSIPAGSTGITIQWNNDPSKFQNGKDQNGKNGQAGGATSQFNGVNQTNLAMGNPIINMNNSSSFNSQFVFTTCPKACTIIPPQYPVSICEVMLHEIGHAFGLDDLQNDPSGMDYPQSVMWGEIQTVADNPCPDKGPQDVDICYFCKLYCPENCLTLGAPLPPGDTSMTISVFPNPATSSFTITYKSLEPYSSLTIEDMTGKQIIRQKLTDSEGSIIESSDKMPAGAYLIRLQGSEHFIVRLLIIQ